MDKRTPERFPASAALHGGLFIDRTLRQFDERRVADPDRSSVYEGTVYALPALDPGILAGQLLLQESSRAIPTEEPRAIALAPQREKARRLRLAISRKQTFLASLAR